MFKNFKIWIKAVRAQFFTAAIIPILLGAAIAWNQSAKFNWGYFLLALIGGVFIHAGLNLANDYYDHVSGLDESNKTPTPFSGGSRMIQENILSPRQVLRASIFCFIVVISIGLYLNYVLPGNILLIVGIIGVFLAFFYSAVPLQIGYTGFGELTCAIGFGPVMVFGSYYVQSQQFSLTPFIASVPVGIMIALVLYINEFPDFNADSQKNKNTLIVIMGKKKAIKLYFLLLSLVYIWTVGCVILKVLPYFTLAIFITLPICISAVKTLRLNYDKIEELFPANVATIKLHFSIGLLMSIAYILDRFIPI